MKLVIQITPHSTNSLATSPILRMFSSLSGAENPKLELRPCLQITYTHIFKTS